MITLISCQESTRLKHKADYCHKQVSILIIQIPLFSGFVDKDNPFVPKMKNSLESRLSISSCGLLSQASDFVCHLLQSTQKKCLSPAHVFTECVTASESRAETFSRQRPELFPPDLCMRGIVFEAYQLLSSMHYKKIRDCKKEMEILEQERDKLRNEKLIQWKKHQDKTKSMSNWSSAMAVFSWISCCLEIFTGMALLSTGNVVGGSILLAGGLIQLTNHIMVQTGGWDKVAEELPGDNPEEKKKVISWMQIGIAIFSVVLAGAGATTVGMSTVRSAMGTASSLAVSGLAIGVGITTIGHGINQAAVKDHNADLEKTNVGIQKLDFRMQDLREDTESTIKDNNRLRKMAIQASQRAEQLTTSIFTPINK